MISSSCLETEAIRHAARGKSEACFDLRYFSFAWNRRTRARQTFAVFVTNCLLFNFDNSFCVSRVVLCVCVIYGNSLHGNSVRLKKAPSHPRVLKIKVHFFYFGIFVIESPKIHIPRVEKFLLVLLQPSCDDVIAFLDWLMRLRQF